ncbi:hypothetical protein MBANPS3_012528 [Mucor bainieri]
MTIVHQQLLIIGTGQSYEEALYRYSVRAATLLLKEKIGRAPPCQDMCKSLWPMTNGQVVVYQIVSGMLTVSSCPIRFDAYLFVTKPIIPANNSNSVINNIHSGNHRINNIHSRNVFICQDSSSRESNV